jgi:hypothetical protein
MFLKITKGSVAARPGGGNCRRVSLFCFRNFHWSFLGFERKLAPIFRHTFLLLLPLNTATGKDLSIAINTDRVDVID